MFPQTVTLYIRHPFGKTLIWMPLVLKGVNLMRVDREETGEHSAAAVSGTVNIRYMMTVPLSLWPESAGPGDYVVEGECEQDSFLGNAAEVLLPLGGRQIEQVMRFSYGSPMDHAEVVLR